MRGRIAAVDVASRSRIRPCIEPIRIAFDPFCHGESLPDRLNPLKLAAALLPVARASVAACLRSPVHGKDRKNAATG